MVVHYNAVRRAAHVGIQRADRVLHESRDHVAEGGREHWVLELRCIVVLFEHRGEKVHSEIVSQVRCLQVVARQPTRIVQGGRRLETPVTQVAVKLCVHALSWQ